MNRYLARRLLLMIPILLVTSLVIFVIISLAPGDPLSQFAANPVVRQISGGNRDPMLSG